MAKEQNSVPLPAQETAKHRAKFGYLASVERRPSTNEATTRNPLKFAGVPNFVSDIDIFVLKRDVKLQLTN